MQNNVVIKAEVLKAAESIILNRDQVLIHLPHMVRSKYIQLSKEAQAEVAQTRLANMYIVKSNVQDPNYPFMPGDLIIPKPGMSPSVHFYEKDGVFFSVMESYAISHALRLSDGKFQDHLLSHEAVKSSIVAQA